MQKIVPDVSVIHAAGLDAIWRLPIADHLVIASLQIFLAFSISKAA